MFSGSLGGVSPRPRTFLGTRAQAAPPAAASVKKVRREIAFFLLMSRSPREHYCAVVKLLRRYVLEFTRERGVHFQFGYALRNARWPMTRFKVRVFWSAFFSLILIASASGKDPAPQVLVWPTSANRSCDSVWENSKRSDPRANSTIILL